MESQKFQQTFQKANNRWALAQLNWFAESNATSLDSYNKLKLVHNLTLNIKPDISNSFNHWTKFMNN